MKYTLDTDFSSLNGPKAANWIRGFQDMAEDAFIDLTDTPLPSNKAADVMSAQEQVYQTLLFRQVCRTHSKWAESCAVCYTGAVPGSPGRISPVYGPSGRICCEAVKILVYDF